uniref:Uncharacterized protein n=1 Tax=Cryptomonas curvata TaxID=233186 RepID=A0A7S0MKH2_9CRYP|mmetsp:Transcript_45813/g.95952  ORF Transcript_45813/g.95952 Transcript_45813/m.95952 type:complete len:473 (+) Transcript_45813:62-1480(+)
MKQWAHLIAAMAMMITAIVLYATNQNNDTVRPLDRARFYTLVRDKGDMSSAANLLKSNDWLPEACQLETNLTQDCLLRRTTLRDKILDYMKCTVYSSQACTYLRLGLKALAQNTTDRLYAANGTYTTRTMAVGKKLYGKAPNGETYNDILRRMVEKAPLLFHSASRADQSDSYYMLHSVLYTLITVSIGGNLLVHILDTLSLPGMARAWARMSSFALTTLFGIIFVAQNPGIFFFVLAILVPAFVALVYFEYLLDPTLERPWIHPATFSIIYSCTTLLALTQNGVLDFSTNFVELLIAAATSQVSMGIVWYQIGSLEKLNSENDKIKELHSMYETKEIQYALYMAIVLIVGIPLATFLAPYSYTNNSSFLLISPVVFAVVSVLSTLVIQEMALDDMYGEVANKEAKTPTTITAGKLYVSFLLLLFGLAMTVFFLTEHMATFRTAIDTFPDKSIQSDVGRSYLFGQGVLLSTV